MTDRALRFLAGAIAMSEASGAPFGRVFALPTQRDGRDAPPDVTAAVKAAAEAKRLRKLKRGVR